MKDSILTKKPVYTGIFEAHITLDTLDFDKMLKFKELCDLLQVKPIQIELSRGDVMTQPMTCSRHEGNLENVIQEVKELANILINNGLSVNRLKIEASPFNQDIPQNNAELKNHSAKNYFEHHLKILLDSQSPLNQLITICEKHKAHLSSNAFKKIDEHKIEKFITIRCYGLGKLETEAKLELLKKEIQSLDIEVVKTITEYCVFDDNVDLDNNWLTTHSPCVTCENPCK